MTGNERVHAVLNGKVPDMVPVFEWIIDDKVAKAISGTDDVLDCIEILDLDAVVFRADYKREFIDENTYKDEWGFVKKISGESIHSITEHPIDDIDNADSYIFPDPASPYRLTNLKRALSRFGNSKAVILNIRDVFSDIRDLLGFENALVFALTEPEKTGRLIERCMDYNLAVAEHAKKELGIDIVVTTDDYATGQGLLFSPTMYKEFFYPKFKKLITRLKNMGFYCIKHTDGNIKDIIELLVDSGIDCLDPIDPLGGMDISQVKKQYGERICLKGNIDNLETLVSGTLKEVADEVKLRIEQAGYGGGYILSSSNTIHSGVNPDNFKEMVRAAREFGKYPTE